MAVEITPVQVGSRDVMGAQLSNTVAVADGAVSSAFSGDRAFYKIRCTSDCTVRIGLGLANAANGEKWKTNEIETRTIPDGYVVAVDAAA